MNIFNLVLADHVKYEADDQITVEWCVLGEVRAVAADAHVPVFSRKVQAERNVRVHFHQISLAICDELARELTCGQNLQ